jgi:hypothetical protein
MKKLKSATIILFVAFCVQAQIIDVIPKSLEIIGNFKTKIGKIVLIDDRYRLQIVKENGDTILCSVNPERLSNWDGWYSLTVVDGDTSYTRLFTFRLP